MQIKHSGLRALHERGDGSRLSAGLVPRLRRILLRLEGATRPGHMAVPGYRLHPLKGEQGDPMLTDVMDGQAPAR